MSLEWKEWYRHYEGEVLFEKGFRLHSDDDYWYFGIDPYTQTKPVDEDDEYHYVHVDNLYESSDAAHQQAVEWCRRATNILDHKMKVLGIK